MFSVIPLYPINWNNPPRRALVDWGKGGVKLYHLEYLSNLEVKIFWQMDDSAKAEFIRKRFNRHHRRPRCQKGPTKPENLSYVDIVSHESYNRLISFISRWSGISIEEVQTEHLSRFLRKVYPSLVRLIIHKDTRKMRSLEDVLNRKNLYNLSPFFIHNVAGWSGLEFDMTQLVDVRRYISFIYPAIKRLAYDHKDGKFRSFSNFVRLLNTIWLPIDEQIVLKP